MDKTNIKRKDLLTWISFGLLLIGMGLSAFRVFPYYFVYYNPIWGKEVAKFGYGALLDEAAAYLGLRSLTFTADPGQFLNRVNVGQADCR